MELAVGLSPQVHASLAALVDRVVEEAETLGFVFEARDADDTPGRDGHLDVARLASMQ
jgi:hypothetical protein